jgi:hypothetical protein
MGIPRIIFLALHYVRTPVQQWHSLSDFIAPDIRSIRFVRDSSLKPTCFTAHRTTQNHGASVTVYGCGGLAFYITQRAQICSDIICSVDTCTSTLLTCEVPTDRSVETSSTRVLITISQSHVYLDLDWFNGVSSPKRRS